VDIEVFPFTKEKKNDLKKELKISILSINIDELKNFLFGIKK